MKNQIIRIKHQNGRYIVKGKGDHFRLQLSSGEIITGVMEPTFGYKLRRFLRRLVNTANAKLEELQTYPHLYPEQSLSAAEVPFIGLEE